jgi:hypothetical protein
MKRRDLEIRLHQQRALFLLVAHPPGAQVRGTTELREANETHLHMDGRTKKRSLISRSDKRCFVSKYIVGAGVGARGGAGVGD